MSERYKAEIFGDIEMDFLQHRASIGEHRLELTPKEFLLLYALVRRAGEVVRRTELCATSGTSAEDWSLASHVYRLRKKLEGTGYGITLARARGYRLEKE